MANGQRLSTAEDTILSGQLTGSDVEGNALTYTLVEGSAVKGSVTVNPDGTFTFTPDQDINGTAGFKFVANDGTTDSTPVSVLIAVSAVNDAPVANGQSASTDEDSVLSGHLAATDVEGDSLTYALVEGSATHGSVMVNADGSFTFTPDKDFNGSAQFRYTANDGTTTSEAATVTITVKSVNDAPTANGQRLSTAEDTVLSGQLTASDVEGGALTYRLVEGSAIHGSVTVNPDGSFTFTPDQDFNGTAGFKFVANDGTTDSTPVSVVITVNAVNDLPTITAPASAKTSENADLVFHGITVADVDAGDGEVTVTLSADHGTLSLDGTDGLGGLTGNNSATVSFTGTLAAVNAALDGLTFHPQANYTGAAGIGISVDDQSDSSGPAPVFRSVAVAVEALPVLEGVQIGQIVNGLPNQRSQIDRIVVTFSGGLTVHSDAAFTLIRNGAEAVPVYVAWSSDFSKATLTFDGGSLADGNYALSIDGDQLATVEGVRVDADGDHHAGGVYSADFYRFFGDVNGDRFVNGADFAAFRTAFGTSLGDPNYNAAFDVDGDGFVNGTDFAAFRTNFGGNLS
jgi:VCBS repeat-containing protein